MKTTLKFKLRSSQCKIGSGILTLMITRHRQTRSFSTSYTLFPAEWDAQKQAIIIPEDASAKRKKELACFSRDMKKRLTLVHKVIEELEKGGDYSVQDIVDLYREQQAGQLFCEYVRQRAENLQANNRLGTARISRYAELSFSRFQACSQGMPRLRKRQSTFRA